MAILPVAYRILVSLHKFRLQGHRRQVFKLSHPFLHLVLAVNTYGLWYKTPREDSRLVEYILVLLLLRFREILSSDAPGSEKAYASSKMASGFRAWALSLWMYASFELRIIASNDEVSNFLLCLRGKMVGDR